MVKAGRIAQASSQRSNFLILVEELGCQPLLGQFGSRSSHLWFSWRSSELDRLLISVEVGRRFFEARCLQGNTSEWSMVDSQTL